MKRLITILLVLLNVQIAFAQIYLNKNSKSQDSISVNPQKQFIDTDSMYSRDNFFFGGFLRTISKYPERFGISDNPTQTGFLFGTPTHIKTIDEIKISEIGRLSVNLGGEFKLGFAYSSNKINYQNLPTINPETLYDVKHYTIVADVYSINLNTEYVTYFSDKRTATVGLAITFLNLGGTFTYMSGGVFDKKVFAIINTLPFYIQPYGMLKLKGASLGFGLLINPFNLLEFRVGPTIQLGENKVEFFQDESTINFSSSQISKYALKFYVIF